MIARLYLTTMRLPKALDEAMKSTPSKSSREGVPVVDCVLAFVLDGTDRNRDALKILFLASQDSPRRREIGKSAYALPAHWVLAVVLQRSWYVSLDLVAFFLNSRGRISLMVTGMVP